MSTDRKYASDVAFSPAVKAAQKARGSRETYARMEAGRGWATTITEELAVFLRERDSFYLATANAAGQPYIQHRGGSKGFLKVLDDRRLAFADFPGNRQYVTVGNLSENDKVQLFLMDYVNRRRVKVWGRAQIVEDDTGLLKRLADPGYATVPERAVVIEVDAWDVNCPKHIVSRFAERDVREVIDGLHARIEALEAALAEAQGRSDPNDR